MAGAGSPEYEVRWRYSDLPLPPRICALRASERRTPDSGFGGWPTPMAGPPAQKGYNEAGNNDSSRKTTALVAGWPTTSARDWKGDKSNQHGKNARPLNEVAELAGWGTPRSVESGHTTGNPNRALNHRSRLEDQVYLAGWATPNVPNGGRIKKTQPAGSKRQASLETQTALAGWPTPDAAAIAGWATPDTQNHRDGRKMRKVSTEKNRMERGVSKGLSLHHMATLASGTPTTSSLAETENRGALSPEHSRWIMGFPPAWASCAPTAMPSSRKSRRRS
jgi:hypothetical protein